MVRSSIILAEIYCSLSSSLYFPGDADVMIAGGCEAPITPLSFAGFCNLMAMNTNNNECDGKDPKQASRPFDMGRGNGQYIRQKVVCCVSSLFTTSLLLLTVTNSNVNHFF